MLAYWASFLPLSYIPSWNFWLREENDLVCVLVCEGCQNEMSQTEKFKLMCVFWKFQGWGSWDGDVGRAGFFWDPLPWPVDGLLSLFVCVPITSFKDTGCFGLGPSHVTSFYTACPLKALCPNVVAVWKTGGQDINTCISVGHNSVHNNQVFSDLKSDFWK